MERKPVRITDAKLGEIIDYEGTKVRTHKIANDLYIYEPAYNRLHAALYNKRSAHNATRKELADARQEVIMLKGQVDAAKSDLKKCGVIHNTLQSAFHHGPMTKGFIGAIAKVCDDLCKVLGKGDASKEAPAPPAPPEPGEGYRILVWGEYVKEGDEINILPDKLWHSASQHVGNSVCMPNTFRRKIAPVEYACPECGASTILHGVKKKFLACGNKTCMATSGDYSNTPHASWIKKTEDETNATSM